MINSSTLAVRSSKGNDTSDLADLYKKRMAPTVAWSDMRRSEHFVQFYQSDSYLENSVAEYMIHGLKTGEACLLLGTGEHLSQIRHQIRLLASGLDDAIEDERFIAIRSDDALAEVMSGDMADEDRFKDFVSGLIEGALRRSRQVRIFGELVGVLCADGNYRAAVRLEELWNEICDKYPVKLFCAYPVSAFSKTGSSFPMGHICATHGSVIPDESYTSLTTADARLREIAHLQQKSRQMQAEIRELERRLAAVPETRRVDRIF